MDDTTKYAWLYSILDNNCRINDTKWCSARLTKPYLTKLGIYEDLMNCYSDSSCLHETIYRLEHGIHERPVCKMCGNPINYSKQNGFSTYCSPTCSNNDPEILAKNKAGVSKALKKAYAERGDEIKRKRAKTLTGDENGCCSPYGVKKWQEKGKQTIMDRYGVDNVLKLKEKRITKERYRELMKAKWASRGIDVNYEDGWVTVHNACPKHPEIRIETGLLHARLRRCAQIDKKTGKWDISCLCRECHPVYKTNIERFVSNVLERMGLEYEFRSHKIIKPYELDFYIPSLNFAIETNGVYWHNLNNGDQETAVTKYRMCYDQKIRFVTLWEDDIMHHGALLEALLKCWLLGFFESYFEGLDIQEVKETSVAILNGVKDTVHLDQTGLWIEGVGVNQPVAMKDAMWMIDEPMVCNAEVTMCDPEHIIEYTAAHNADGQEEQCLHLGYMELSL